MTWTLAIHGTEYEIRYCAPSGEGANAPGGDYRWACGDEYGGPFASRAEAEESCRAHAREHACVVPGCGLPIYANERCEAHYRRARRGSTSTAPVRPRGREALRALSLRLPVSVWEALGDEPGARAREVLTEWAKRRPSPTSP